MHARVMITGRELIKLLLKKWKMVMTMTMTMMDSKVATMDDEVIII